MTSASSAALNGVNKDLTITDWLHDEHDLQISCYNCITMRFADWIRPLNIENFPETANTTPFEHFFELTSLLMGLRNGISSWMTISSPWVTGVSNTSSLYGDFSLRFASWRPYQPEQMHLRQKQSWISRLHLQVIDAGNHRSTLNSLNFWKLLTGRPEVIWNHENRDSPSNSYVSGEFLGHLFSARLFAVYPYWDFRGSFGSQA